MKLKQTTRARMKNLGIGFLCLTLATSATAQENSPIPKSLDAPQVPASSGATTSSSSTPTEKIEEEVIVVGYGTQKRKDVTGAISSVSAKDFNPGIITTPDQLIQGKAAGIQITSSDGSPNSATTVRIRGNSAVRAGGQPLYIVDGVFMDGGSPKPGITLTDIGGDAPASNPLSFINPLDIASMEILKDASATAIYGSRGANGVILITTKKGTKGTPKIEFNTSYGLSAIAKRIEVANGDQYRQLLSDYVTKTYIGKTTAASADYGGNVDALGAILRTGTNQRYNLSVSGGGDNANFLASFGYQNLQGIVRKTSLENFNVMIKGALKFFDGKVGVDFSVIANQSNDQSAPISNAAGFKGSLIGQALQWNPTLELQNPLDSNGSPLPTDTTKNSFGGNQGEVSNSYAGYTQNKSGDQVNPLAYSNAFDDYTKTNTFIASIAPYIKLTQDLTYKVQLSTTQSTATRKTQTRNFVNILGVIPNGSNSGGVASIGNNQYATYQITHTLSYNKQLDNLSLNALLGYEYYNSQKGGTTMSGKNFGTTPLNYYDILNYSATADRTISSYYDPTVELQSYFGRVSLTYNDKYSLTATLRADGSSKFGANNKYGYFPSLGVAWNIDKENFLKNVQVISFMRLRATYGLTGNQDFPAGASQVRYIATAAGTFSQISLANPNLKWQTDKQLSIGLDFGVLKSRVTGTVEFFNKQTSNLLINLPSPSPSPGIGVWSNLPSGIVANQGVELTINAAVVTTQNMIWNLGVNATFIQNQVTGLSSPLNTAAINGQGVSGAFVQQMLNGYPLNTFYLKQYEGISPTTGLAMMQSDIPNYYGSPNPKTLLGINTSFTYKLDNSKSLTVSSSLTGAFGHYLYNNTANTILPINGIGSRNVSSSVLNLGESPASPITTSTRYLEKGDYLRLANATISYNHGNIGTVIKNLSVYITGQNLYVWTKFTGFDPEVNVDKALNGVPSVGIEYAPYPTARSVVFGVNISL